MEEKDSIKDDIYLFTSIVVSSGINKNNDIFLQNITINIPREQLFELSHSGNYMRFVNFPIDSGLFDFQKNIIKELDNG